MDAIRKELEAFVGQVIASEYRLERVLGAGGMGGVFLATRRSEGIEERFAIKVILPRFQALDAWRARFLREGKMLHAVKKQQNPNVVGFDKFGVDEEIELPFLVMEFIEGRSLAEHIRLDGRFSAKRTTEILNQILGAMITAHHCGIIHRDLKPANVMLVENTLGDDIVKVVDFGLAKPVLPGQTVTPEQMAIGTPLYMAPEQMLPDADERLDFSTDVYAVGLIAHTMLSGAPPFNGVDAHGLLEQKLMGKIAPLPGDEIPAKLKDAILTAVAPRRGDRFNTMNEFRHAVKAALAAEPPPPSRPPLSPPLTRPPKPDPQPSPGTRSTKELRIETEVVSLIPYEEDRFVTKGVCLTWLPGRTSPALLAADDTLGGWRWLDDAARGRLRGIDEGSPIRTRATPSGNEIVFGWLSGAHQPHKIRPAAGRWRADSPAALHGARVLGKDNEVAVSLAVDVDTSGSVCMAWHSVTKPVPQVFAQTDVLNAGPAPVMLDRGAYPDISIINGTPWVAWHTPDAQPQVRFAAVEGEVRRLEGSAPGAYPTFVRGGIGPVLVYSRPKEIVIARFDNATGPGEPIIRLPAAEPMRPAWTAAVRDGFWVIWIRASEPGPRLSCAFVSRDLRCVDQRALCDDPATPLAVTARDRKLYVSWTVLEPLGPRSATAKALLTERKPSHV